MDRLKQIESFVSVAARGSLTAAAHAEGVAPAVIGRRIDALEERLGVKLLVRTTRKITLTHEGSAYLEDCQRLLADLANAEASVSAGGVKASGYLRVTAPAGSGPRHVAPLVPRFIEQHPDVNVSLNLSDRVVDIVNESYDCAVRVGDLPDSSLISVRMAFRDCIVEGDPLCGRLQPEKNALLYGPRADEVQSSALLPVLRPAPDERRAIGLVAVGSRDPNRFFPGMGTLFLRMMAEGLAAAMRRFD